MESNGCFNGSSHGANSPSAIILTGLYVAGASLVCVAVMLYDFLFAGILAKKRWLPCKYFKLDSIGLTLLGAAAKLPQDLTRSMPGRWDQLSKLTGTAIICIAMGFAAPSVGMTGESESFTNMVALSIFVASVAVNISFQLYNGLIVLFFVEHIIMLCLMLILLLMLWQICFYTVTEKRSDGDRHSHLLSTGSREMFERLKLCSLYAYCFNPQLRISSLPINAAISPICVGCLGIVVETAFRCLFLNQQDFCEGVSAYGWSITIIVIIQIATVLVGSVVVVVRCIAMFPHMGLKTIFDPFQPHNDVIQMKRTLRTKGISLSTPGKFLRSIIIKVISIAEVLIAIPSLIVYRIFNRLMVDREMENDGIGFNDLANTYLLLRGVDDMSRLNDQVAKSPAYVSQFLSLKSSSLDTLSDMKIQDGSHCIEVCCLSMALLVKIAETSIPKHLLESLLNIFHQAKEVVHFIDKMVQPKTSVNIDKLAYARAVWKDGSFTCLLPSDIRPTMDHVVAVDIIRNLRKVMNVDQFITSDTGKEFGFEALNKRFSMRGEVSVLLDYILDRSYSSMEELYGCIEKLFVDMLHALYAQLPEAIFKSLTAAPVEEFEGSVRVGLKFLFKIGSLECQDKWSFPAGMKSFVTHFDKDPGFIKRSGMMTMNTRSCAEFFLPRGDPDFEIIPEATEPSACVCVRMCNPFFTTGYG